MSSSTSGSVAILRERPHLACIVIDRPAARNAIDPAMAEALEAAAEVVESDTDIRAVVLTGAGGLAFSAGADLATLSAGRSDELLRPRGGYLGLSSFPRRKPWIAAIRGVAAGGGLELALSCDLIVAGETARLGLPETSRGTIAGACGVYRLPKRVPRAIAIEWLATADLIGARRCYEVGLVNRLVPDEQVIEEAYALAGRIARNSPVAVRESLAIARIAAEISEEEARALTDAAVSRVNASPDNREGPAAFLEKRMPRWSE